MCVLGLLKEKQGSVCETKCTSRPMESQNIGDKYTGTENVGFVAQASLRLLLLPPLLPCSEITDTQYHAQQNF